MPLSSSGLARNARVRSVAASFNLLVEVPTKKELGNVETGCREGGPACPAEDLNGFGGFVFPGALVSRHEHDSKQGSDEKAASMCCVVDEACAECSEDCHDEDGLEETDFVALGNAGLVKNEDDGEKSEDAHDTARSADRGASATEIETGDGSSDDASEEDEPKHGTADHGDGDSAEEVEGGAVEVDVENGAMHDACSDEAPPFTGHDAVFHKRGFHDGIPDALTAAEESVDDLVDREVLTIAECLEEIDGSKEHECDLDDEA